MRLALFSESVLRATGRAVAARRPSLTANAQLRELSKTSFDAVFDIFLSHSYLDSEVILGLRAAITDMGFKVYVDWVEDSDLRRSEVSRETAALLRRRMRNSESLFYATSTVSPTSRWMPWECGYFDGLKGKVAICPLVQSPQSDDRYVGQEYLSLYPYVATWRRQGDAEPTLWIHESPSRYVNFAGWLKGNVLHEH